MIKRVLLGIDAPLSPATRYALRTVSDWCEQASIILLHVIPTPNITSPALGMYVGHIQPTVFTLEQRSEAEVVLHAARVELQHRGVSPEQIETIIRSGTPADELARAAKEIAADFIVIGSRGNATSQKLRRLFMGSISRRVLALAPCPVMIIVPPEVQAMKHTSDLVRWYEQAITRYLQEHEGDLTVFTPAEVAQLFAPPNKREPGRKERAAAILALEQLARNGVLCRHDVKGELRYVND
ncbi:MAG TPA: universal stress protein [Ktedonobacteraceae bacterium]|jgi:nucleotide-binding universal stress UspA family protein|nr:universal stress protein [Ktedonobacteraceae bacterium]